MKLEGLRVLDLSLFLPGPHLTMMMADHGAEVIKIEPWPDGEPVRWLGHKTDDNISVWFRSTHRGKKSLRLNLQTTEGQLILQQLATTADVFVEAFPPGVAQRLGCDYRTLSGLNPGLVYTSLSAFGQTGPYRDRPAQDLAVEAMAGIVSQNLDEQGHPVCPAVPAADMAASLTALSGILMALFRRSQTGQGDYLDIAMFDSLIAWTPGAIGPVFAENRAPTAKDERNLGGHALNRLYETADGRFIALGGADDAKAGALLQALGRGDLAALFAQGPGPHVQPVLTFLADCFKTQPLASWGATLEGVEISWAPVRDLKEAFEDPHTLARAMRLRDDAGHDHIGVPIKFQEEPAMPSLDVPALGGDAARLLQSLGYDRRDVDELKVDGVI